MVAVIHVSQSLCQCLNYNEQKVAAGEALLLEAGYYPMDARDMTFRQKLARLEKLTELNQRTQCNSVHISLNFDPSDKLSARLLIDISELYLEKIGFAGQPYLLYQHFDAGHPHVHLVTTQIQPNGRAIYMHDLAKNEWQKARREIEVLYGLVRAEDSAQRQLLRPAAIDACRIIYGRVETKWAIDRVLRHVLKAYRFTSLSQLNALLSLYNLTADTGGEHSRLRQRGGLLYRVLDTAGKSIGKPIKAGDLPGKPTLKVIRGMFPGHQAGKAQHLGRVSNAVGMALMQQGLSFAALRGGLQRSGIDLVVLRHRRSTAGELFYVDHTKKTVFSGIELGPRYRLASILERCTDGIKINGPGVQISGPAAAPSLGSGGAEAAGPQQDIAGQLAAVLLDPGYQPEVPEWQARRRRKKKKRQVAQSRSN